MFDRVYSSLVKRYDYRFLAVLPPIFAILMILVVLVNGLDYGLDFKGGMWVEALTNNTIDAAQVKGLVGELQSAGLKDVKVDVAYDVNTGQNKLIVQTTTVFEDRASISNIISKYTGELSEYDIATVSLPSRPPVELKDNLMKRLKYKIDLSYADGVLTISGIDLFKEDLDSALSYYLGQNVDVHLIKKNYSIRTVGPTLGETFRTQGFRALLMSFVLMSIVVFLAFKEFIPCVAVIQAAIVDISIALGGMSLLHIALEPASIGALLMLIGYSVDTDILLTTRTLKDKSMGFDDHVDDAVKTGLTMSGTTIVALTAVFIVSVTITQIPTWSNISSVIILGVFGDMPATWLTNACILKWYIEGGGRNFRLFRMRR